MRDAVRLRIQAAGRFTPTADQLDTRERVLVFRAVQSVIGANGFLAQPAADLLVNLRSELRLDEMTDLGDELTAEELREGTLTPAAADYLCFMALLAGFADGQLSDNERRVIDGLCEALQIDEARLGEIKSSCLRAILEANVLMNLPEVIEASELARRYCQELDLNTDALEGVGQTILQSLAES